jgi:hypothetical protein
MLPDASTIVPLDPEEFLTAQQYAGMVAENELLEEIPDLPSRGSGRRTGRLGSGMILLFSLGLRFDATSGTNLTNLRHSCGDFLR